jgi:hypothetical protein
MHAKALILRLLGLATACADPATGEKIRPGQSKTGSAGKGNDHAAAH